jgi:hypothetical protein
MLANRAEIIAQMKFAGRLNAAENTFRSGGHVSYPFALSYALFTGYNSGVQGHFPLREGGGLKRSQLEQSLVEALRQALTEPGEQRLYKSGKLSGLFPSRNGAHGSVADQALRDGLLEIIRTETKGKTVIEWVRLTPRGVEFLHERESPLHALQELRSTLQLNQQAVPAWLMEMRGALQAMDERLAADARKWLERLDALTRRVEETLRRLEQSAPLLPPEVAEEHPWAIDALNYLDRRRLAAAPTLPSPELGEGRVGGAYSCPLPELFTALLRQHPDLSVRLYHEGLRRLHERRLVQLQPAASLADLPQPEYALLEGAAIFYYVTR